MLRLLLRVLLNLRFQELFLVGSQMTGTHSPQPGLCGALCQSGRVPHSYPKCQESPPSPGGQVAPAQCMWDETEAQMAGPRHMDARPQRGCDALFREIHLK